MKIETIMKKLVLSLFSIVALMFFVTSCSQSIEEQEVKPSKVKVDMANKGEWLRSIISKHTQSKGARTATLCGGGTGYLGHLGTLVCNYFPVTVPSNVDCGYFSFEVGSEYWNTNGIMYSRASKVNWLNAPNAHIYIIDNNGALLGYGYNDSITQNIAHGTVCYVVFIKTESGLGEYMIETSPSHHCSDLIGGSGQYFYP